MSITPLLRFGCRMLATMNVTPETKTQLLKTAPRCLSEQSLNPHNIEDTLQPDYFLPRSKPARNVDGFGALLLEDNTHYQTETSLASHTQLPPEMARLQDRVSGLFHIRDATVGTVNQNNSHPYAHEGLGLIQNGELDGKKMDGFLYTPHVVNTIKTYLPSVTVHSNDSDSRRVFYYWVAKLKQQYPKQNLDALPTEQLIDMFQRVQNEILATRPARLFPLKPGSHLPISGTLNLTNKINSIIAAGKNRIIALKHGKELNLGFQVNTQGQMSSAILATEPPKISDYTWVSLPDHHWVVLTKQPDQHIEAELIPFNGLLA